ncbi:MAG: hypothetical protein KGL67_00910 [Patescibacteria group bacterium]|nr:hypothetical protein [Patescibacteria group bacterium]
MSPMEDISKKTGIYNKTKIDSSPNLYILVIKGLAKDKGIEFGKAEEIFRKQLEEGADSTTNLKALNEALESIK